jgi:hypothetical protein
MENFPEAPTLGQLLIDFYNMWVLGKVCYF